MAMFNVATLDGKEITIELDLDLGSPALPELLQNVLKPGGWLVGTEVKGSGRDTKRTDILIFGNAIVAIREAWPKSST